MGPDDFLAQRGAGALNDIIDVATPADPVAWLKSASTDAKNADSITNAVNLLDDTVFLVSVLLAGTATQAACRIIFRQMKMTSDYQRALTKTRQLLHEADCQAGTAMPNYTIVDGCLCTREGRRLANFDARIMEEVTLDDGIEQTIQFMVEVHLCDGTRLGAIMVTPEVFLNTNWATGRFGAAAQVAPGPNSLRELAAAIQSLSAPVKTKVFSHTGFADIGGEPVFLLPGNDKGPTATVKLDGTMSRYGFTSNRYGLPVAHQAVLRLLDVAPLHVEVPLLLAALRAPINTLLPADFVLQYYGTTGVLKSSLVALNASFCGQFTHCTLPASFNDTVNSLEYRVNIARDVVLPVDELVARSNSPFDETVRKGEVFVRQVGNGAGKGRMTRECNARTERTPKALVVTTGEQTLPGESLTSRTLAVPVHPGDVDRAALTEAQRKTELLQEFMRHYVEWIRLRLGVIGPWAKARHQQLREELQASNQHLRTPSILANLLIGAELFGEFSQYNGLMTQGEGDAFVDMARDALLVAAARQREASAQANPIRLFLGVFGELLQTGVIHLGGDGEDTTAPGLVGWRKNGEIILLAHSAYREVARALRDRGELMPVSAETLWTRMRDDGLLVCDGPGRTDTKRTINGKRLRVRVLRGDTLDDYVKTVAPHNRRPNGPVRSPSLAGRISGGLS